MQTQRGAELLIFCAEIAASLPAHTPLSCPSPTLHTVPTPYSSILPSSSSALCVCVCFFPLLCKLIWLKEVSTPSSISCSIRFLLLLKKKKKKLSCCYSSQIYTQDLVFLPSPELDSHLLAFWSRPALTPIPKFTKVTPARARTPNLPADLSFELL